MELRKMRNKMVKKCMAFTWTIREGIGARTYRASRIVYAAHACHRKQRSVEEKGKLPNIWCQLVPLSPCTKPNTCRAFPVRPRHRLNLDERNDTNDRTTTTATTKWQTERWKCWAKTIKCHWHIFLIRKQFNFELGGGRRWGKIKQKRKYQHYENVRGGATWRAHQPIWIGLSSGTIPIANSQTAKHTHTHTHTRFQYIDLTRTRVDCSHPVNRRRRRRWQRYHFQFECRADPTGTLTHNRRGSCV